MAAAPLDKAFDGRTCNESFPLTRWSLVGRAGLGADVSARQALGILLQRYLPALRSHLVARKRFRPDDADELLQGFVAGKVLERNLVGAADQTRGKFRSFLLTALDRFVIDEQRRAGATKRRPNVSEQEVMEQPARQPPPDRAFDVEWGRQILAESMRRMREECVRTGRDDLWGTFEERVVLPATEGLEPVEYDALVRRYGFQSPAHASNAMITSKRMFARHLRAVVGEYVDDPAEIDQELRDLRQIASANY